MKNDRSVPPPHHRVNYDRVPETIPYGNTTRLMYFTGGGACTYAYGLSYRGAQKFLKYMSMEIYSKPVDIGIREMCQNKDIGLKCIGIFPQIFSDHKLAGGSEKDSDIGRGSGERAIRTKDYSTNLVRSTLMNVEYLIDGKLDKIESQYPDNDPHVDGPIVAEYTDVPLDRAIVT